jgi:hypothetical protein
MGQQLQIYYDVVMPGPWFVEERVRRVGVRDAIRVSELGRCNGLREY